MEEEADSLTGSNARGWKRVKILGAEYLISTSTMNNSWKILMTNLVEVWTETISRDIALARCQLLNFLLDLDSFDINETLNTILNDIPKYATEKSLDHIQLESSIDGIAFKFSINLAKGSPQQFWEEITKPLCQSSMELHRKNAILLDLIKKKDEELLEYKLSGAQLTRKNIETLPYSNDVYGNQTSINSLKSDDYMETFESMMELHKKLSNNVHKDLPQETRRPDRIELAATVLKQEDMEASDMRLNMDTHDSKKLQPVNKIETTTEHPGACGSETLKTEIVEQSESTIDLRIDKNERNMRSSPREQPNERPKRLKKKRNIYDIIR